jgi:hypothetical protein
MRHVFPTSEIPHLWAHQSQSDARNPQGNLFFQGPTIYSYRTSWPLARIYTKKKTPSYALQRTNALLNETKQAMARDDGVLVLTNSERYSIITAAHQSAVNRSVPHLPCVAVPNVNIYPGEAKELHARNMAYFAEQIAEHLAKAKRAMQVSTVEWRTNAAVARSQDAIAYSVFFGIRRKAPTYDSAALTAALDRARRIETPDPVRDAAKIRARERKAARDEALTAEYRVKLDAHYAAQTSAWRAGGNMWEPDWWRALPRKMKQNLTGGRYGWAGLPNAPACMLRVSGDQIESSMGARIPLEHAPRLWRLIQACRGSGRAYARNGHTEHAGTYAIDAISAEGELRAGCHTIPYAELELLARTLGLPC